MLDLQNKKAYNISATQDLPGVAFDATGSVAYTLSARQSTASPGWHRTPFGWRAFYCPPIPEGKMKPVTLTIYADTEGVTSVLDEKGVFVSRERVKYLISEMERMYRSLSDAEIERYQDQARRRNSFSPVRKGYVYLVKSYDDFYKIGQARDPISRIRGLQLPYRPKLIHTIWVSDMNWAERHLHTKYAHRRVDGEWFVLDGSEVAYIKSLRTLEPPSAGESEE